MESFFFANLPVAWKTSLDAVGNRILREYGSVFSTSAVPPPTVIFVDEQEVNDFERSIDVRSESINGIRVELQAPAMEALQRAVVAAASDGRTITPRGEDASRRSYADTVTLWKSRVEPGLDHWVTIGRLAEGAASRIRSLSSFDQVPAIFELENQGLYFSKDLAKSIIYSVAPPGTSQHLSMLALDVTEHDQTTVREILAKHGWYQTVVSDLPHFTFLGFQENELAGLGLKKEINGGREYWLPSI